MWLPKEERKLLMAYYNESGNKRDSFELPIYEEMKILGFREDKTSAQATDEMFALAFSANDNLKERGLIYFDFEHEQEDISRFKISLTLNGLDLGRKYNSFWICSGLWFREYEDHWIWLIVGFVGGIIGAFLVNCLSKFN